MEPDGRRVRLTPAGRRLADKAVSILAAVESARRALDPDAEPVGSVRIGGFATAIRRTLLPVAGTLVVSHPDVRLKISESEPHETLELLAEDDLDLGLIYDYNLAPATIPASMRSTTLWTTEWGLAVPEADGAPGPVEIAQFRDAAWIVNSRNTADDVAVGVLAGMAGFSAQITHRIDSLSLVADLVRQGYGVGLLPLDRPTGPGDVVLPLPEPRVSLTAYSVTRRGREDWPPLRLVLDQIAALA